MEQKSSEFTALEQLYPADLMKAYDAACKKLLSHRSFLAWVLKAAILQLDSVSARLIADQYIEPVISKGRPAFTEDRPSRILGNNTGDTSASEGKIIYDLIFRVSIPFNDSFQTAIINLEIQNDMYPRKKLRSRSIYNVCRAVSSQKETVFKGTDYDHLLPVYGIWIYPNVPALQQNNIVHTRLETSSLNGRIKDSDEISLINITDIYLGPPQQASSQALYFLDILFSPSMSLNEKKEILEKDFQIKMTTQKKEELSQMGYLGEAIFHNGIEQGLQQGLEQGLQQGLEQGIRQGLEESEEKYISQWAEGLVRQSEAFHKSIPELMQLNGLPSEEQKKILAFLARQKSCSSDSSR